MGKGIGNKYLCGSEMEEEDRGWRKKLLGD